MRKFAPTINRIEQTITVSRAFQIAAGNVNSAEYQEYLRMKEQYPDFTIIVHQKSRKKADDIFGKLTYSACNMPQRETSAISIRFLKHLPRAVYLVYTGII